MFLFTRICLLCWRERAELCCHTWCSNAPQLDMGTLYSFWAMAIQAHLQSALFTGPGMGTAATAAAAAVVDREGGVRKDGRVGYAEPFTSQLLRHFPQDSFLLPCLSSLSFECPSVALTFAVDFSSMSSGLGFFLSVGFCQSFISGKSSKFLSISSPHSYFLPRL